MHEDTVVNAPDDQIGSSHINNQYSSSSSVIIPAHSLWPDGLQYLYSVILTWYELLRDFWRLHFQKYFPCHLYGILKMSRRPKIFSTNWLGQRRSASKPNVKYKVLENSQVYADCSPTTSHQKISLRLPRNITSEIERLTEWPNASGGFAVIHIASWRHHEQKVKVGVKVIKTPLHPNGRGSDIADKRLRREILVWSQLDHPNILQLLGIAYGFGPPGTYGMVSPWIDNGNLSYYLDQHRMIPISNRISMVQQIANGLHYLHSNSVVHGDLTGNNVLVEKDGHMLLGDFGLSSIKEDYSNGLYDTSSTPKYNLPWTAPEIVLSEAFPRPNQTTDIYSFGSVTLQVLTGVRPYQGMSEGVICRVLEKRGFPDRPKCGMVHDDFWELMLKCWSRNSEERPGIADINENLSTLSA